jgi:protocatechuate 3,4-dioxygenase alpha subunit
MSAPHGKLIPTSSQTVGPYFRIGLQSLIDGMNQLPPDTQETITLTGRVLDADGRPVPDAMLEFWGADNTGHYGGAHASAPDYPRGFVRVGTGDDGSWRLTICRPGPVPLGNGADQAPHLLVLVFARGLLRNLVTRVYFANVAANAHDLVLNEVPTGRRATLIARADEQAPGTFHWDIVLQGKDETVFFAW